MNKSTSLNFMKLMPINTNPNISPSKNTIRLSQLNHHSENVGGSEENRKEVKEQPLMGSSRWNPTAEQLLALEEMYRRGTRTPTAEQIQEIALHLRRFGKIEGKNVFYWFQNHKARERQKRRREVLDTNSEIVLQQDDDDAATQSLKDLPSSGLRRTAYSEFEQSQHTKNFVLPSNCTKQFEGFVPMHKERGTRGWSQFEERELHQRSISPEKHATWQTITPPPKLFTHHGKHSTTSLLLRSNVSPENQDPINLDGLDTREVQTLELFPLSGSDRDDHCKGVMGDSKKDTKVAITAITNFSPNLQFFEFLPLKKY